MRYIDIHTHANLAAFDEDRDEVVGRALDADVAMVNVGTQRDTSQAAVELAAQYESGVYATVGLHPIHTTASFHDKQELGDYGKEFASRGEEFDTAFYRALGRNGKVVAIGECGFDYYRLEDGMHRTRQLEAFEAHIALANELGKPLMLHLRSGEGGNAYKDAASILKKQAKVHGNSHFFAGSLEDAKLFWDMGYSTSFTGVITFTDAYDDVVRAAPHELIHAETDAPYVAPRPYRGKRNEPLYVKEGVLRMAQLRGVGVDEMAAQLFENARAMFGVAA